MACTYAAAHLQRIVTTNARHSHQDEPHHDADSILQDFRADLSAELSYAFLTSCVMSGFPSNRHELHNSLLPYWKLRNHLYADWELVLYDQRIVVPTVLCCRTLARRTLHDSLRGVEATRRRAR